MAWFSRRIARARSPISSRRTYAPRVVEERCKVTDADQFLLSNLMNNVADTDTDFPSAPHVA
jgi:hypothetical protein